MHNVLEEESTVCGVVGAGTLLGGCLGDHFFFMQRNIHSCNLLMNKRAQNLLFLQSTKSMKKQVQRAVGPICCRLNIQNLSACMDSAHHLHTRTLK